jgi:hypothetical protein
MKNFKPKLTSLLMLLSIFMISGCLKFSKDDVSSSGESAVSNNASEPAVHYNFRARKDLSVKFVSEEYPDFSSVSIVSVGRGTMNFSKEQLNGRDSVSVQTSPNGYKVIVVNNGKQITRVLR